MGKYQKPKRNLHREFIYLNHATILNSLSAFEAGAIDSIVQKTSEASDGGFDAGVGVGGAKLGASKKKQANIQEELIKTRTWFSGFDTWLRRLEEKNAIGLFEEWDEETRNELSIGDTIKFTADVRLSPIVKLFTTFMSFANPKAKNDLFQRRAQEISETKRIANMLQQLISSEDGKRSLSTYFHPYSVDQPRLVGWLEDSYIISGLERIEESYTVIAQVRSILRPGEHESAMRALKDTPPLKMEIDTIAEAMKHFRDPAAALGAEFKDSDVTFGYPDVLVHPIAVYK